MNLKTKVTTIVLITVALLVGLFFARYYYYDSGIFADTIETEQKIFEKTASGGDFSSDQITGLTNVGNVLQAESGSAKLCGSSPDSVDISDLHSDSKIYVALEEIVDDNVTSDPSSFYFNNTEVPNPTGNFFLTPATDDITVDDPGFSIVRGNGWVYVELDESQTAPTLAAIQGTLRFTDEVSLNSESLSFEVGGDGLENSTDGIEDPSSQNDEVSVDIENNEVNFYLATSVAKDSFYINYCFDQTSSATGTIVGQLDLGKKMPVTSLRVDTVNFAEGRDQIKISSQISKDNVNWQPFDQVVARTLNYQTGTLSDEYCFRYIQYNIEVTTIAGGEQPLGIAGIGIFGAETCGVSEEIGDPGSVTILNTACSNGVDDDGDSIIDLLDPGCSSSTDNSEEDTEIICRDGSNDNIYIDVNISEHQDGEGTLMGKEISVGSSDQSQSEDRKIDLVSDGIPILDSGVNNNIDGISIYRGEGYLFIYNQSQDNPAIEGIRGSMNITGSTFSNFINSTVGGFEQPENGSDEFAQASGADDELAIASGGESLTFSTTTHSGADGIYVYYDYDTKLAGGCQCQDGLDNDSNDYVDYPDDPGCDSPLDDDESVTIVEVVKRPICSDGLDNDEDGSIDYPEDSNCESIIDNSEDNPNKVCKLNPDQNISFSFADFTAENEDLGDLTTDVYMGNGEVYQLDQEIALVTAGVPIVDETLLHPVPGVSVKRGPGYIYLMFENERDKRGAEKAVGKIVLSGATISEIINGLLPSEDLTALPLLGPFENATDGVCDTTAGAKQDEYSLNEDADELEFCSTVLNGADSVYVYYDYEQEVPGGCQCQDGLDNDQDGLIDYPADPGCTSAEDEDETDTVIDVFAEPSQILPALIKSGSGFWILIGVVVLISGITIYLVVKADDKRS